MKRLLLVAVALMGSMCVFSFDHGSLRACWQCSNVEDPICDLSGEGMRNWCTTQGVWFYEEFDDLYYWIPRCPSYSTCNYVCEHWDRPDYHCGELPPGEHADWFFCMDAQTSDPCGPRHSTNSECARVDAGGHYLSVEIGVEPPWPDELRQGNYERCECNFLEFEDSPRCENMVARDRPITEVSCPN